MLGEDPNPGLQELLCVGLDSLSLRTILIKGEMATDADVIRYMAHFRTYLDNT